MSGTSEGFVTLSIFIFTLAIIGGTFLIIHWLSKRTSESKKDYSKVKGSHSGSKKAEQNYHGKKKPVEKKSHITQSQIKFEHPHLLATLKGHTAPITGGDFSPSGKHFITAAEDRTVLIWSTKEFSNKDRKCSRGNIEYDHAQHICWSPDSRAFIIYKDRANVIEVYKMTKKPNGTYGDFQKAITFPEENRDAVVIVLAVAVHGRFIMSCDDRSQLILWDLRGGVLEKFDTRHGETYSAIISPCGRFIATTGFTPDAKVWEVHFAKNGSYEGMKRVYDLKGHRAGIYNCSFNSDSSKMVTISKDGTWRLYNTQVEYEKGQEPYFIMAGKYEKEKDAASITLSPDGRTIAVASAQHLSCYSAINGNLLYTIQDIYLDPIAKVIFDPSNKLILTLGDKHVRVFHNVAGYKTTIQDLEKSRSNAKNLGMKERIEAQIKEAKTTLAAIENSPKNW